MVARISLSARALSTASYLFSKLAFDLDYSGLIWAETKRKGQD